MAIKKGDLVTRNSYNNDTIFKVINIKAGIAYLKGVEVRLYADSPIEDLVLYEEKIREDNGINNIADDMMNRSDFFYLPGKVLHIEDDLSKVKN